ncbi:hypothetical protein ACIRP2_28190 [Streptomyces sp. NPDC101194]|uniref:hypothetical protein n=1 Tax=Streptomyces sp. NPDC101194 TaxID=3366127 RepID=UPI0038127354
MGKFLLEGLQAAGQQVTVANCGSTQALAGVEHLVVDRNDEAFLTAALGSRTFDVAVDQVRCAPAQAAVVAVAGRTRCHVMTSTIEGHDPATAAPRAVPPSAPVPEAIVDPATWLVVMNLPWRDDAYLEAHCPEDKRQAKTVFARADGFESLGG